ncbi:hypothetical protein Sru01_46390 [Sphaerisporangium rufum]|uniref:Uncharacterized protein n=1 Tax=Sphaerisporangium rufum TaxID=1381558 RepID=A0A919R9B4_9ACTN|nr:hypothetical protein [Sphaerisporangium rufum]GII79657.1 hypothetical protein Sru01_46390 [Sphaerisporangium rufum]
MATYTLPAVSEIRGYLKDVGWVEQGRGQAGSLWRKDDRRIGIPHAETADPDVLVGALRRIAGTEQVATLDLLDRIRYRLMDRAELKTDTDREIVDTIPLRAATTMLSAAKSLLRSAATTAWHERTEISGNYARRGDAVAKQAHMAHTKRGSFIIPIIVPLPSVDDMQDTQPYLEGLYQSPPEPFERRVTRTFAQSLQALQESVVEPAREPTKEVLRELVERGVSREFCTNLGKILKEPAIGDLQATFNWASSVPASVTIPKSVAIEAESVELVERAADKLRRFKIDTSHTFSGNIVALRRNVDDARGEIAISTVRRGRQCEIWIDLSLEKYQTAISWHRDGRTVLAEGVVKRGPGRRLVVNEVERLHPIDEMYIPGIADA